MLGLALSASLGQYRMKVLVAVIVLSVAVGLWFSQVPEELATAAPVAPDMLLSPQPDEGSGFVPLQSESGSTFTASIPVWGAEAASAKDAPPAPTVQESVLVAVYRDQIQSLQVDDQIVIPVPQTGTRHEVRITSVQTLPSGNLSLNGKVVEPELGQITITLSERGTFATLNLPGGSYSLRGNTDFAWITSRSALARNTEAARDYLLPPAQTAPKPKSLGGSGENPK